jgi:hypothetical protein
MTEENRWDIFEGAKGRTGHGDKSRLQGDTDPMTRSELFTDHSPFADAKSKPLSQLKVAEASRKLVPSDVSGLEWAHGEPLVAASPSIRIPTAQRLD